MSVRPLLAVIPARGGSRGLPGKNIRPLCGLPLIAHSIRCARMCREIDRCIVSTDSEEIADVARAHGAEVPFLRPADLAQDTTPMWPVLQHALREMETRDARRYESFLLLDPTSPGRMPADVTIALRMLDEDKSAAGVVAVSEPPFNPRWVCVEERAGYMQPLVADGERYARRQDVPKTYRINAVLYMWRREHVLGNDAPMLYERPHRMLIVPEERAIHIDELHDFQFAYLLMREGIVEFPWLAISRGQP